MGNVTQAQLPTFSSCRSVVNTGGKARPADVGWSPETTLHGFLHWKTVQTLLLAPSLTFVYTLTLSVLEPRAIKRNDIMYTAKGEKKSEKKNFFKILNQIQAFS